MVFVRNKNMMCHTCPLDCGAAESCVTPRDKIWYYWSSPVFGLISNWFQDFYIEPALKPATAAIKWTIIFCH